MCLCVRVSVSQCLCLSVCLCLCALLSPGKRSPGRQGTAALPSHTPSPSCRVTLQCAQAPMQSMRNVFMEGGSCLFVSCVCASGQKRHTGLAPHPPGYMCRIQTHRGCRRKRWVRQAASLLWTWLCSRNRCVVSTGVERDIVTALLSCAQEACNC